MASRAVFINAPYDKSFEPLFLAYLVGVTGFGLVPCATIQIQGAGHRITRILDLIHSCDYSIHDLSRVELSPPPDSVPKFNMPFELGLAYHHSLSGKHTCFIFEAEYKRFERSLGDLKGVDIYQHKSSVERLFSELTGAFVKENAMPSVRDMLAVYILTTEKFPSFCSEAGTETLFHPRVFDDVIYFLRKVWADRLVKTRS